MLRKRTKIHLQLKEFLYCKCILATLLQNRGQYLKIFVLSKVLNFVLLVPPVFWFRYYARIILLLLFTMKFFCIFFRINFSKKLYFFCDRSQENQEVFSERCSLISGVLRGLVKTCKKYMEVNHSLLLSCSLEK